MDSSDSMDETLISSDEDSKSAGSSDSNSTIRPLSREEREIRSKARIEAERRANIGNPALEDDLREILDIIRKEKEKRRAEILSVGPPDADDERIPYWRIFTGIVRNGVDCVIPVRLVTRLWQGLTLPESLRLLVPNAWRLAARRDNINLPKIEENKSSSPATEYLTVSLQTVTPISAATSSISVSTSFSHSGTWIISSDISSPITIPDPHGYLAFRRRESASRRHRRRSATLSGSAPPALSGEIFDQYAAIQRLNEDVANAAFSLSPLSTRTLTNVLARDNENLQKRGDALWWREWEKVGRVWSMP